MQLSFLFELAHRPAPTLSKRLGESTKIQLPDSSGRSFTYRSAVVKTLRRCNGCAGRQAPMAAMRSRFVAMPLRQLQPLGSRSDHDRFRRFRQITDKMPGRPQSRDRHIGIKCALKAFAVYARDFIRKPP
jgi:hypothetical protein